MGDQNPNAGDDKMEGVEMGIDAPVLNEQEKRILDVYDRMEELQFEIALLKAQGVLSNDAPESASDEDMQTAQKDLLEAKAAHSLKTQIVENVLIANPILNAVHAGSNAAAAEQDLLPFVEQRDALSFSLSELSSRLRLARETLIKTESEHVVEAAKNIELSASLLSLAAQAGTQRKEDIEDAGLRVKVGEAEAALHKSRQRWRIMKDTASAVVVGSGVDWSREPALLKIVLDEDEDA